MFSQVFFIVVSIFFSSLVCKATTFSLASNISLPSAQSAIASADLNEDGKPDLIIGGEPVGSERGKIRVLLGNGNGTFAAPTEYVIGVNGSSLFDAPHVQAIKVADFDGDGNLDVVVAHNGERDSSNQSFVFATILFGFGDGRLKFAEGYKFLGQFSSVVISSIDFGDFNNDGKKDIVLGAKINSSTGTAFFLENRGDRLFERKYFPAVAANIYNIATADFDRDSFTDLIMTTNEGVIIIYGSGNYFDQNSRFEQRDMGLFEIGLAVGDFNADGKADFAVADRTRKQFRVFLNGSGGFPENPVIYETTVYSDLLKSADLNGDGKIDLIVSDNINGDFQAFYGSGSGTFGNPEVIPVNLPVSDFAFDDFDGNGKTDIAFSLWRDPPASQAGILLNAPRRAAVSNDFDGDGKAEVSVFRPDNGAWYIQQSLNGFTGITFGFGTDQLVPADYDGDGKTDIAVYRNGIWYVQRSQLGFTGIQFGDVNDVPVPADYDGDGRADLAVFRPSSGTWYLRQSSAGFTGLSFGFGTDKPVPADYDGDGRADIAVNRGGIWYIQHSRLGFTGVQFGDGSDKLVPADYDGDGKADLAVFRPGSGNWYLLNSTAGFTGFQFGFGTDQPVPADYDGDGKADTAVFRNGNWYLNRSSQGLTGIQFGTAADKPIPNVFVQ